MSRRKKYQHKQPTWRGVCITQLSCYVFLFNNACEYRALGIVKYNTACIRWCRRRRQWWWWWWWRQPRCLCTHCSRESWIDKKKKIQEEMGKMKMNGRKYKKIISWCRWVFRAPLRFSFLRTLFLFLPLNSTRVANYEWKMEMIAVVVAASGCSRFL